MDPRKQLGKIVKRFFKKDTPRENEPDLQSRIGQQRSSAKGVGVNPFDLPWTWDDRKVLALVLAEMTPSLPKELRNDIVGFASKPKFIQDFCIDMETAGEIEQILDQDPALKSAMCKFPSAIKRWSASDFSAAPEHSKPFTDIAAEILNSPAIPAVLKDCVETEIDAILMTTDPHKRFAAASLFLRRLAGFGIKTD
ncbi:hypothetical protein [Rhizobacter sp. P5_C2]